jgi:hypothetical protein
MRIADVFVACDTAVENRVPLRPPDPQSAGSPFQNWFEDCLRHAGIANHPLGSRSFPDFVLDDSAEGFELKGLVHPGREGSFDANSQLPKGEHGGYQIYYVFGRYPKDAEKDRAGLSDLLIVHGSLLSLDGQPIHKNNSIRGGGSYGDILIRMRKMFAPPTPFAILGGTRGRRTLVVPAALAPVLDADQRLHGAGTVVRHEAEQIIRKITVDLSQTDLDIETDDNPDAGVAHEFNAYRTLGQPADPITLSLGTGRVQVLREEG